MTIECSWSLHILCIRIINGAHSCLCIKILFLNHWPQIRSTKELMRYSRMHFSHMVLSSLCLLRLWLSFFWRSLAKARFSASKDNTTSCYEKQWANQNKFHFINTCMHVYKYIRCWPTVWGQASTKNCPDHLDICMLATQPAMLPVSSLFWVRSAGQELLVMPTTEGVIWRSLL